MGGEEAEIRFCEHKRLNMATLRMTWEAKVQLKEILINSGFPEGKSSPIPNITFRFNKQIDSIMYLSFSILKLFPMVSAIS
jgi:hypothetical protein